MWRMITELTSRIARGTCWVLQTWVWPALVVFTTRVAVPLARFTAEQLAVLVRELTRGLAQGLGQLTRAIAPWALGLGVLVVGPPELTTLILLLGIVYLGGRMIIKGGGKKGGK